MEYIADESQLILHTPFKATYKEKPIVLFKTNKGIFAMEDRCSHEDFPLSESLSSDTEVSCQLHGSTFDLASGKPKSLPALFPVKTYQVTITEGKIFVSD